MSGLKAGLKIALLVLGAAMLGWIYGYTATAVMITLSAVICFWLYEIDKVQRWLSDPEQDVPDTSGIWSDLLALIYFHQRKSDQVQAQLQSTVEYMQSSLAVIRDGVVMVGEDGIIAWFNRSAEPLLGLRYPEDTGQRLTNLVRDPEFADYFLAQDYSEPLQFEVTGGSEKVFLRVEITHFGEGDRVLFIRDVSDSVRMEKMRSDFVANVSHELRTPLTVITGYLGTIEANVEDLPQRYRRPLEQMGQQAHRMESVLHDLLWLSKIESGQSARTDETVDIGGLLQELRDELGDAYPKATLLLELSSKRSVIGSYQQLYSAVSNLVINAIKYSGENSAVTVSWFEEHGKSKLSVSDAGIGIDAVHLPRLTERFYRVDDSRNSATGGTGLGLAIVKHVAAAHGARLLIESQIGEGSTFSLIFSSGG